MATSALYLAPMKSKVACFAFLTLTHVLAACTRPSAPPAPATETPALPLPMPSAPSALPLADGGGSALSANVRGEKCLEDLVCSAAEVQRLFVQSDDAREHDVNCFRFLDGVSVARDVSRARTCFERIVGSVEGAQCDHGRFGADLSMAILATMRIDAVGGVKDVAGARAYLASCAKDVTQTSILEHAANVERDPKTLPVDFCKDIGGTTITSNACQMWVRDQARDRGLLAAKVAAAGLSEPGMELLRTATTRYDAYVKAAGLFVYQVSIKGSIRGLRSMNSESTLQTKRAIELAAFKRYAAPETSIADVAKARTPVAEKVKTLTSTGPVPERDAFKKSQEAWNAYRDAEIAFYVHVFGPAQGEARVRNAMTVRLETRRVADIVLESPGSGTP
jgi:Lysozyme inhibitor LprI